MALGMKYFECDIPIIYFYIAVIACRIFFFTVTPPFSYEIRLHGLNKNKQNIRHYRQSNLKQKLMMYINLYINVYFSQ